MGLSSKQAAIVAALRSIGIDGMDVPDHPRPQLQAKRTAWAYPLPGDSAVQTHSGGFQNLDEILVEYHHKLAADQIAEFLAEGAERIDQFRQALWLASNQALAIRSINTTRWGSLGWGTDHSYGFRLSVAMIDWGES